ESYESASPLFPFCVVLREGDADNCHSSRLALVRSSHYRAACAGSWPSPPVAGNWFPRSAHVESGVDWVGAALQRLRLSQVRKQTGTGVSGRLRGGESFIGGQHICLRGALPGFRGTAPHATSRALLGDHRRAADAGPLHCRRFGAARTISLDLVPVRTLSFADRHSLAGSPSLADCRWLATPLFASLVAIEAVDVVFALDSIPAIFAITTDPFIVLTSNVFAIFGLRTMFFLLGGAVERFKHLSIGLALVLIFVGAKLIVSGVYQVPVTASLVVIIALLGSSILASLWTRRGRSAETA